MHDLFQLQVTITDNIHANRFACILSVVTVAIIAPLSPAGMAARGGAVQRSSAIPREKVHSFKLVLVGELGER